MGFRYQDLLINKSYKERINNYTEFIEMIKIEEMLGNPCNETLAEKKYGLTYANVENLKNIIMEINCILKVIYANTIN